MVSRKFFKLLNSDQNFTLSSDFTQNCSKVRSCQFRKLRMKWFHENFSRLDWKKQSSDFANSNDFTNNFVFLRKIIFFHAIPLLLQELTDEFAIKIPEDRTVAKQCVAIEVLKRSKPKSRNGVNASFTGVVTSNVKHVQKMSNLQSVNNYERNETKSTHL